MRYYPYVTRPGHGRMRGDLPGSGPGGDCLCTMCGARVQHQVGVPCYSVKCRRCGAYMTRDIDNNYVGGVSLSGDNLGIAPVVGAAVAAGAAGWGVAIYKLIKPGEQEPGTKYEASGITIKGRTRIPPNGVLTWVNDTDYESIVITIVDGADTLLRKMQVTFKPQLAVTATGARNTYAWDKRYIGWKGSGKGKWFKADPSRGHYYYYIDGEVKEVGAPAEEHVAKETSKDAQSACARARLALEQGNLELAQQETDKCFNLSQQSLQSASEAGTDEATLAAQQATQAAGLVQSMLLEAQQLLTRLEELEKGEGEDEDKEAMPMWIWAVIGLGALLLLRR